MNCHNETMKDIVLTLLSYLFKSGHHSLENMFLHQNDPFGREKRPQPINKTLLRTGISKMSSVITAHNVRPSQLTLNDLQLLFFMICGNLFVVSFAMLHPNKTAMLIEDGFYNLADTHNIQLWCCTLVQQEIEQLFDDKVVWHDVCRCLGGKIGGIYLQSWTMNSMRSHRAVINGFGPLPPYTMSKLAQMKKDLIRMIKECEVLDVEEVQDDVSAVGEGMAAAQENVEVEVEAADEDVGEDMEEEGEEVDEEEEVEEEEKEEAVEEEVELPDFTANWQRILRKGSDLGTTFTSASDGYLKSTVIKSGSDARKMIPYAFGHGKISRKANDYERKDKGAGVIDFLLNFKGIDGHCDYHSPIVSLAECRRSGSFLYAPRLFQPEVSQTTDFCICYTDMPFTEAMCCDVHPQGCGADRDVFNVNKLVRVAGNLVCWFVKGGNWFLPVHVLHRDGDSIKLGCCVGVAKTLPTQAHLVANRTGVVKSIHPITPGNERSKHIDQHCSYAMAEFVDNLHDGGGQIRDEILWERHERDEEDD